MKLTLRKIIGFLEGKSIAYKVIGDQLERDYTIASIFTTIPFGFYYCKGGSIENIPEHSVVLTDQQSEKEDATITYIIIRGDPQETYYCLLDHYFGRRSNGEISNFSIVHKDAILGDNVQIGPFTELEKCRIGSNVIIGGSCKIHEGTIIGDNVIIENGCIIGAQGVSWIWNKKSHGRIVQPQMGGVVIGENCFLGAQTVVVRGSLNENSEIGANTVMAPGGRIGHGTKVGIFVHFANGVITGGNSIIGDYSFVGSGAVLRPKVKLCNHTIVGAGSVVVKNQEVPGMTLMGVPAKQFETKEFPSGMPQPLGRK